MAKGPAHSKGTVKPGTAAFLYGVFAALWILASGYFLSFTFDDPATQQLIELGKGLLFVVVTSLLLYALLRQRSMPADNDTGQVQKDRKIIILMTSLLLAVPLAGYGILRLATPIQENQAYANLEAIARLQAEGIRIWRDERINDINALTQSTSFIRATESLVAGDETVRARLKDRMDVVKRAYQYHCVLLVSPEGRLLESVGIHPELHPQTRNLLAFARTATGPVQSDLYLDAQNSPSIDFIAPVNTAEGTPLAYVVTRTAPEEFVFDSLGNLPLPATSLETLLIHSDDSGITAFHLTRRHGHEQRLLNLDAGQDDIIDAVLTGKISGRLTATDRKGEATLAVHQPEPATGWQLVARISRDQALAPLQTLATWIGIVIFTALAVIGFILVMLWRQQHRAHLLSLQAAEAEHERKLHQQAAVYRELFDSNPHPMWVYDQHSLAFLAVNTSAIEHYGYSRDEFLAMTIEQIRPEQDLPRLKAVIASQTGTTGIDRSGLWRHRTRDGTLIDVEISSHAIRFEGRDAKLVLAYDMTERQQLLTRLAESDRFAHDTLDALPLRIAVLDDSGTVIAANRLWQTFNNENPGAAIAVNPGHNYLDICRRAAENDPDSATVLAGLEQVLAGNRAGFTHEYPFDSGNGESWFLVHITRFGDNGKVHIVVAREEVTQRKQAELELRKLNRYYAALSRMNTTIIRSHSADEILGEACRIAAEQGELALVWASSLQPDGTLQNVAASGEARDYVDTILIRLDHETDIGPINTALRTGETSVCNNLDDPANGSWSRQPRERGFRAIAACPIRRQAGTWGCLAFYASEPDYFTPDLLALLDELTADLSYSLDTLELEQSRANARRELLLNARILESSHEGLLITDDQCHITMVNRALCEITGYDREELLGRHVHMLAPDREIDTVIADMASSLAHQGRWEGDIWQRRRNGELFPAWLSITRVQDEQDNLSRDIVIYRDVTERKEYEKRIEHLASHDVLTDLPNRVLLDDRITQAIARARRQNQHLALLFIDLDSFKLVNDTLGHDVGDELLREVAHRIVAVLRDSDTVSRVGGDEFIALLTDIHQPEDAALVAEKIIHNIGRPCDVGDRQLVVTASVGIALFPDHGQDAAGLTRLADTAMLSAKQGGHNRYQFYTGELGASAGEYLDIQNELRGAIDRGELFIAYQPQCLIDTGRVIGVEALARWRHPRLGQVSPLRFIPIAENSGMIVAIGSWIMTEACRQVARWRDQGIIDTRVSVNVSALQFRQRDFIDRVNHSLEQSGLSPTRLELEVTESLLMHNNDESREKLRQLYRSGIRLAIDDFGTGYSSLSYLRHFPAQRLKIDKSFVNDLPDSTDAAAIARSIISLGLTMGMEVIAEGVETRKQADFLRRIRCQQAQGYLYSKPLPADEFENWLLAQEKHPN